MKKNLITKLCVVALATFLSTSAFAQNGRFSVGAELGLPMGDFGDATSLGFGGSLRYEHPLGDNMGLTLTAGYLMFSGKEIAGFELGDWGMIPAQVGIKYYFTEQQEGFYGMLELGIHSVSYKAQIPTGFDLTTGAITYSEETISDTNLSYAPEIGYHLANVDLGLRYQLISTEGSTTSYLGVRLAYVFGEK